MDRLHLAGNQGGPKWGASWRGLGLQGGFSMSVPEDLGLRSHESALGTLAKERMLISTAVLGRVGWESSLQLL